jgi:hypothetical protein
MSARDYKDGSIVLLVATVGVFFCSASVTDAGCRPVRGACGLVGGRPWLNKVRHSPERRPATMRHESSPRVMISYVPAGHEGITTPITVRYRSDLIPSSGTLEIRNISHRIWRMSASPKKFPVPASWASSWANVIPRENYSAHGGGFKCAPGIGPHGVVVLDVVARRVLLSPSPYLWRWVSLWVL